LISKGFKIDVTNKTEKNALHLAIINRNTEIAKFLIEKGINTKKVDTSGKTPLTYAVEKNNLVIADILLKK